MIEKLVEQIESRFAELSQQMSDPEVIGDRERYAEVGRAYSALEAAHALAEEWRRASSDAAGAREMLSDGRGPGAARAAAGLRTRAWPSWTRRSAWRWSSPTPATRRT